MNIWEAFDSGAKLGFFADQEIADARKDEIDAQSAIQTVIEKKLRNEILRFEINEILPLRKSAQIAALEAAQYRKKTAAQNENAQSIEDVVFHKTLSDAIGAKKLGYDLITLVTTEDAGLKKQVAEALKEKGAINQNEFEFLINGVPVSNASDSAPQQQQQSVKTQPPTGSVFILGQPVEELEAQPATGSVTIRPTGSQGSGTQQTTEPQSASLISRRSSANQQSVDIKNVLLGNGERLIKEANNTLADLYVDTYINARNSKGLADSKRRDADAGRLEILTSYIGNDRDIVGAINEKIAIRLGPLSIPDDKKVQYVKHAPLIQATVARMIAQDEMFKESIQQEPEAYSPYYLAALDEYSKNINYMSPEEKRDYKIGLLNSLGNAISKERKRQLQEQINAEYLADKGLSSATLTFDKVELVSHKKESPPLEMPPEPTPAKTPLESGYETAISAFLFFPNITKRIFTYPYEVFRNAETYAKHLDVALNQRVDSYNPEIINSFTNGAFKEAMHRYNNLSLTNSTNTPEGLALAGRIADALEALDGFKDLHRAMSSYQDRVFEKTNTDQIDKNYFISFASYKQMATAIEEEIKKMFDEMNPNDRAKIRDKILSDINKVIKLIAEDTEKKE